MADFNSAWTTGVAAMDELVAWDNQTTGGSRPNLTARLAGGGTVTQAQLDAANALAAARRTALDGMIADIQTAATADTAEGAADSAGDAARAAALLKGQQAP